MKIKPFICLTLGVLAVGAMLLSGCSVLFGKKYTPTKVVAAPFGVTMETRNFKMGTVKPAGYIMWGDDVDDGEPCSLVISSSSLGRTVFSYFFTYSKATATSGYNFPGGAILEPDPFWYDKCGTYVVTLYVRDRRISSYTFDIKP